MKLWAIGDVHGCYDELMAMMKSLKQAGLNYKRDKVIFLGDYIDRGPDSRKVIEQLMKWSKQYPHWVFLYGNHEDLFIDWYLRGGAQYGQYLWEQNGGDKTMANYGMTKGHVDKNGDFVGPSGPQFPKEHVSWIYSLPLIHEEEDFVFVHGGLIPETSITECRPFSRTLMWARDGFITSDYDWGKTVIFGHTANSPSYGGRGLYGGKPFYPIMLHNKIGIDCACCPPGSKRLAAVELPEKKFHFIEAKTHEYSTMDFELQNWKMS